MTQTKQIILATLCALAVIAPDAVVWSQGAPAGFAGSPFDSADTDGDGRVSRVEFIRARSAHFARFDHNKDGVIDQRDFPRLSGHPRMLSRVDTALAAIDINGDGSVSRTELANAGTPMFTRVDADRDGYVTPAEVDRARDAARARRQP